MEKISNKLRYGLTHFFMIACFILALSVCFFIIGFIFIDSAEKDSQIMGIWFVFISFPSGIIAAVVMTKCKAKLNMMIDYGNSILYAAEEIKDIIKQSNVFGVRTLQDKLKIMIEKELLKAADVELKK